MAIEDKKYNSIHGKTGSNKNTMKAKFDDSMHTIAVDYPDDHPEMAAIIYQIGQLEEEIDYLRGLISTNKDKTTFPGFGTSSTTALAGDTTTISTAQANEITANTAKVSQNLKTANHTMQFDVINSKGTYTLLITIIDGSNPKAPVTKTVALALK